MFLSLRSLLSCFQHSITNHCPYLRTKQIILSRSITFSAFCFFVRNLFLSLRSLLSCFRHSRTNHCPYLRTSKLYFLEASHFLLFFFCQKLIFEFEISSFLLSALKNKSLPIFENKQIILSRSITFSAFFVVKLIFIVMVLETITKTFFFLSLRSLLSYFKHSRTNHCPYLRTKQIILSRSITFSALFFLLEICF